MPPCKQKISITLDEDIIMEIKKLAVLDGRSLSQYINIILRRHIAGYSDQLLYHNNGRGK
ncbi:MAG TPA: toxin-antitoxin system protein [Firmicutes bacterium]|nr:toxin-antitoxin system protein [Bacillota bacterium]